MSTIVLVDDDKVFRELLTTIFKLEGYQTVVTSSTDEIVRITRQVQPSAILMDVHIDRQDTLGVLRELKEDEELNSIPVIMTSGIDRSAECLAAGANTFILKPFRPSEIVTEVKALVR